MGSMLAYINANVRILDAVTFGTSVLDGAGEKVVAIFTASKTDTITKVNSFVSALSNGGGNPVYDVRIETVDTSNGQPTGTLWGTNTNGTLTVSATGEQITTLTAAASVTAGDQFAVVVSATTVGGTQNATFHRSTAATSASYPYALTNTTGSFVKSGPPAAGLVPFYSDGTMEPTGIIVSSATVVETFNSGSTPDERGNLWNFTDSVDVCGCCGSLESNAAAGDLSIVLYDSGGSALITRAIDGDCFRSPGTDGYFEIRWPAQTIAAGANFRLVVKPTTANSARMGVRTFSASSIRVDHWPNGQYTSRTDAGAWSETNTKAAMLAPIVSAVNASGSSTAGVIGS